MNDIIRLLKELIGIYERDGLNSNFKKKLQDLVKLAEQYRPPVPGRGDLENGGKSQGDAPYPHVPNADR